MNLCKVRASATVSVVPWLRRPPPGSGDSRFKSLLLGRKVTIKRPWMDVQLLFKKQT